MTGRRFTQVEKAIGIAVALCVFLALFALLSARRGAGPGDSRLPQASAPISGEVDTSEPVILKDADRILPTDFEFTDFVGSVPGSGKFLIGSISDKRIACLSESSGSRAWETQEYQRASIPEAGNPFLFDLLGGHISRVVIESGQISDTYALSCEEKTLVGFAPDKGVGVATCKRETRVIDLTDGRELESLPWRFGGRPRVSKDGQLVVVQVPSPLSDERVTLLEAYSLPRKERIFSVPSHAENLRDFAISPSGKWIATVSGIWRVPGEDDGDRRELRVLDSTNGTVILEESFEDIGQAVAFSPDNRWLVAAFGNRAYVYSTATWKRVFVYAGHREEYDRMPNQYNHNMVLALAIADNPLRVLSADRNGEVHIWRIPETRIGADERSPL